MLFGLGLGLGDLGLFRQPQTGPRNRFKKSRFDFDKEKKVEKKKGTKMPIGIIMRACLYPVPRSKPQKASIAETKTKNRVNEAVQ